jgi:hypothetical protein
VDEKVLEAELFACYYPEWSMAKFKPARRKERTAPARGGVPCLIALGSAFVLVMLLLYLVLKHANG